MMMNILPMMLMSSSLLLLFLSMFIMLTNMSYIIEWELYANLAYSMKLDLMLEWSTILYSSIVIFISSMVLKFSNQYMKNDKNNLRFTYIVLLFVASMNLLIFIPNMICLLIGWDGLGITSFILVIYYNNSRSLSSGMLTIMTNRLGDTFLLMAITAMLDNGDWLLIYTMNNKSYMLQSLGITMAAMTKSAQLPFSSWLPAAMAAPTPVSALVHSSTLVTAGIFILYRFNNLILSSMVTQKILIITGISTMLMSSVTALYENDMKKIIALSTLSQLGLMTMSLGLNMYKLMFFHMLTHALFKALLFISAGCLISMNNHNQDMRLYGQFHKLSPMVSTSMLIASSAMIGMSFMAGFYSKHMIMEWSQTLLTGTMMYMFLLTAIMLTSMYTMRFIFHTLMTPSMQQSMYSHSNYNNYNYPLLMMSLTSIMTGSSIQWIMPLMPSQLSINENSIHHNMNYCIILIIIMSTLWSMNYYLMSKNTIMLNKSILSLLYTTPMSTQMLIKPYMIISLQLYKYLDQAWLEMPTANTKFLMNKLSINMNMSCPQSIQMMIMSTVVSMNLTIFSLLIYKY
uniref:NADH:ubiquinone reductase (H(+)-translocating) n=1 Tax=Olavius algarvensis TaxID=188229 RepID=A0A7R9RCG1_9ANNE|nr:ND5 CDS [Olavius algarvensis]